MKLATEDSYVWRRGGCKTYSNNVPDTENENDDAGRDDDLPTRKTEGLLASGLFVQITKDRDTDNDHENTEGDEAGGFAEKRPVAGEVATEERQLGHN